MHRAIVEARSRVAFSKRQARDAIWKLRQAASAHFIKRSFVATAGKLGRRTANTHDSRAIVDILYTFYFRYIVKWLVRDILFFS